MKSIPHLKINILTLILPSLFPWALIAEDFLVTNVNDSGPGSLREVLILADREADNTVSFSPELNGQTILLETGQIQYSVGDGNRLIITADNLPDGITIDGAGQFRCLQLFGQDGFAEMHRITITRGQAARAGVGNASGAGIFSDPHLRLVNCSFINNRAGDGGTDVLRAGGGGAVVAVSGVDIQSCVFRDNRAGNGLAGEPGIALGSGVQGGSGGALSIAGDSTISDSVFEGNRGGDGGDNDHPDKRAGGGGGGAAISANGFPLTLTRCRFINNLAGNGGNNADEGAGGEGGIAAVSLAHSQYEVIDSVFIGNASGDGGTSNGGTNGRSGEGGALRLFGLLDAVVDGCVFDQNRIGNPGFADNGDTPGISNSGAAIFFQAGDDNKVELKNCIVSRSTGTAIGFLGGSSEISHCTIVENHDPGSRAALWTFSNHPVLLVNSIIAANVSGPNGENSANTLQQAGSVLNEGGVNLISETNPVDLSGSPVSNDGTPVPLAFGIPFPGSPAIDTAAAHELAAPLDIRHFERPAGALDIGAIEVSYQVDNRLGKRSNPASHRGNNRYTLNPAAQRFSLRLRGNRKSSGFLSMQNDGDLDHLTLRMANPGRKLRAKLLRISGGRRNVTSAARRAGTTATGIHRNEVTVYKLELKSRDRNGRRFRKNLNFDLASSGGDAVQDRSRFKIIARP